MADDLRLYNLVAARESITYEAIKQVQKNVILMPDPAFYTASSPCEINSEIKSGNVIGINASLLIVKYEENQGMAYENYKSLIRYILNKTDSYIALIPHVVWSANDGRKVLEQLYNDFDRNERIILVEDHTASEIKYIISNCRMFIGVRTHATIATYSTCVPTLVVGYSVKARGIARDLLNNVGVSAVVIHMDKGKLWFDEVSSLFCFEKDTV